MNSSALLQGRRILVLEDDYLIAIALVRGLREQGAEVLGPFPRVEQALARLNDGTEVHGAVLDVNVQGARSFSVADALLRQGTPFVFATGYDIREIPTAYAQVRAFQKPVGVLDIAAALFG